MDFTRSLDNDDNMNVFLARGMTRLRLKLDNNDRLWTRREARPFLRLLFWDGSDDLQEG